MRTSTDLLAAIQLSDSFFPTGMYTMSNGLEWLFYEKKDKAADLEGLIRVHLEQQVGPADCVALGNSYKFAQMSDLAGVLEVDQTLFATKLVQEVRSASTRSGTQLVKVVRAFLPGYKILNSYRSSIKAGRATGVYPVALGIATCALGISRQNAGQMLLYSFCVSMTGAALRLGMLDHLHAQKILHNLKPLIREIVKRNIGRQVNGMWQFAPEIDLFQIGHEQMDSKMFIT